MKIVVRVTINDEICSFLTAVVQITALLHFIQFKGENMALASTRNGPQVSGHTICADLYPRAVRFFLMRIFLFLTSGFFFNQLQLLILAKSFFLTIFNKNLSLPYSF